MTLLASINHLVRTYDSPGFDPDDLAGDSGVTVGMVLLKDMRDALDRLSDLVCDLCQGDGFVSNPDARYYETLGAPGYHTGQFETQDPEEIDCPVCGGVGFKPRPVYQPPIPPALLDEELPF